MRAPAWGGLDKAVRFAFSFKGREIREVWFVLVSNSFSADLGWATRSYTTVRVT